MMLRRRYGNGTWIIPFNLKHILIFTMMFKIRTRVFTLLLAEWHWRVAKTSNEYRTTRRQLTTLWESLLLSRSRRLLSWISLFLNSLHFTFFSLFSFLVRRVILRITLRYRTAFTLSYFTALTHQCASNNYVFTFSNSCVFKLSGMFF